jgi:hypothetical protein
LAISAWGILPRKIWYNEEVFYCRCYLQFFRS